MKKIYFLIFVFCLGFSLFASTKEILCKVYNDVLEKINLPYPKVNENTNVAFYQNNDKITYFKGIWYFRHACSMDYLLEQKRVTFFMNDASLTDKKQYFGPELPKELLIFKAKEIVKKLAPEINLERDFRLVRYVPPPKVKTWYGPSCDINWTRYIKNYRYINDVIEIGLYKDGQFSDYKNWCLSDTCETIVKLNTAEAEYKAKSILKNKISINYEIVNCTAKAQELYIANRDDFLKNNILASPDIVFNPKTRLCYYVEINLEANPKSMKCFPTNYQKRMSNHYLKLIKKVAKVLNAPAVFKYNFLMAIDAATGELISGGYGNLPPISDFNNKPSMLSYERSIRLHF